MKRSKNPKCKRKACYMIYWPNKEPFLCCYQCNSKLYKFSLVQKIIYHYSHIGNVVNLRDKDDRKCKSYLMVD